MLKFQHFYPLALPKQTEFSSGFCSLMQFSFLLKQISTQTV